MEKLTPLIIINGYWVGVRRYVKVVVLTEWLWVTMTEDATILSLPLGRVQGGRASGGVEPGGPRPPSVALRLPARPAGRPNRTTTAQREAKRARPPGRLSQSSPVFWVRAPAQLTARPAAALHHLLGQDTSSSVDLRHSKWQYNGGVES